MADKFWTSDGVTSEEFKCINNVDQFRTTWPDCSEVPLEVFIEISGKILRETGFTIPLYKSLCP